MPLGPTLSAANTSDSDQMIRDAIALFDQHDYAGAITLLRKVVDDDPKNGYAAYELAYAYQTTGDLKDCIKVAKTALRKIRNDEAQAYLSPQLSMMQASCHSQSGESKKALKVFQSGLKVDPDDYGLNFNIAITLARAGEIDKAIVHLEAAVNADPVHPSPYYVIAGLFDQRSETVKALLSLMLFVQYEYNTERSATAASTIIDLAFSGVQADGESGGLTIFLSPESVANDDEISTLSVILPILAAASAPGGEIEEPVAETIADMLGSFISLVDEPAEDSPDESFVGSYLLPGVSSIEVAEVTTAYAYYVLSQAGVPGADKWLADHGDETDALVAYLHRRQIREEDIDTPVRDP